MIKKRHPRPRFLKLTFFLNPYLEGFWNSFVNPPTSKDFYTHNTYDITNKNKHSLKYRLITYTYPIVNHFEENFRIPSFFPSFLTINLNG